MKVGDYVRTNYGIAKIEKIEEDKKHNTIWYTIDKAQYHCFLVRKQEIIKSSPDVIDLIEVGDYVNGYPVYSVSYLDEKVVREITIKRPNNRNGVWVDKICNDFEIKSVVTKEQFENMKYKVESEVN